jgi:hypothetical protein
LNSFFVYELSSHSQTSDSRFCLFMNISVPHLSVLQDLLILWPLYLDSCWTNIYRHYTLFFVHFCLSFLSFSILLLELSPIVITFVSLSFYFLWISWEIKMKWWSAS